MGGGVILTYNFQIPSNDIIFFYRTIIQQLIESQMNRYECKIFHF